MLFSNSTDVWVVVIGDEELHFPMVLLIDLAHKAEEDVMLLYVEVGFRVHVLGPFVGRVKQNEAPWASCVGNYILVVTMQNDCISNAVVGAHQTRQSLRHIPPGDSEGLAGGGKAVDLILEEGSRILDVFPAGVIEDLGCLNDIVKDVGDALEPILVLLERKFTVNGEVQPA